MIELPRKCPHCQHREITYSIGVVQNRLGTDFGEYPLLRCTQCPGVYFTEIPGHIWEACGEPETRVHFTADPAMIDSTIKLAFSTKRIYIENKSFDVYTVYLASNDS